MPVTGAIKESIYKGANTSELRVLALKEGMASLLIDGMNKVNAGITSIEEVLAAAYEYI
jgi:type II secretory ATPase GspE/PulE/Tfp pilus assembly ATPase PilB-like protein